MTNARLASAQLPLVSGTNIKTINGESLLGSGDIELSVGGNSTANRYSYTATAGQTTFSAVYSVGCVDVYVNGIRLDEADFTASSGTSIVLATPADLDDIVNIVGCETANAYSKAQVDAFLNSKQASLVSGTNIKTINGENLLGAGNLLIAGGASIHQNAGTLDQGASLVVNHGADAAFKRMVSVLEHFPTASWRLNPILTGDSANATASSSYSSNYAPWKAFKNDEPTIGGDLNFWETLMVPGPHWIAWNFGEPTAVAGVRFHSFSDVSMPSTATVQGSNDGVTWNDVATITPPATHPAYQTYAFSTATYQHWRVYFPVNSSRNDIILGGLAFLSPPIEATRSASAAEYTVDYTATSTRITRVAAGAKQITANVLLGE